MISQKALEAAFPGKGKDLRRVLTNSSAALSQPAAEALQRQSHNGQKIYRLRLEALNAILEGFGVEYIPAGRGRKSPGFHYVNLGDPYTTTIVRFDSGRYRITSWGDIVERGNYT